MVGAVRPPRVIRDDRDRLRSAGRTPSQRRALILPAIQSSARSPARLSFAMTPHCGCQGPSGSSMATRWRARLSCSRSRRARIPNDQARLPRLKEIPFDSRHRFMAALNRVGADNLIYVKGAPERVLEFCAWQREATGDETLDARRGEPQSTGSPRVASASSPSPRSRRAKPTASTSPMSKRAASLSSASSVSSIRRGRKRFRRSPNARRRGLTSR